MYSIGLQNITKYQPFQHSCRMLPTTEDNTEESQQHTEGWSVVTPPKMTASSPEQLIKVKPKVDMFIGIFTAASNDPKYASRRIAIRETWMKQLAGLENVAHGFVIGKPKSAAQERAMQQEEAETGVPFLRLDTEVCVQSDLCFLDVFFERKAGHEHRKQMENGWARKPGNNHA